ncbi:MAG: cation diffusion facilitator family transporter [Dethiobacteria bacterium]|nr:cation transporter [Bacillota bacterium]HOP69776.1 cation diffusion facilitator family transporter [Bacillota bacterium]HPT34710.1 cation diffusion facilitator family transporter [Bacillota bacterium]HPZ65164.1 cation diffusion facilitator family transporter [Bacillota bacterium]HQD06855.1 cation diffusion facilitator family transporter [Bacillota bacterium]
MQQVCRRGEKVALYCLLGNIALALLKALAGLYGGSKAMLADAFNSAADSLTTLAVYAALKIARKPADLCHHYGHGKVEPLVASLVGASLLFTAALIIRDIAAAVLGHRLVTPSLLVVVMALASIVAKEIMFRISYRTAVALGSESLLASAWDHRSDVFSSLGVLLSVVGSILGAHLNIQWLRYLDPLAGLLMACLIVKVALEILSRSIRHLMDAAPREELMEEIRQLAEGTEGVRGVSWIRGRYVGSRLYIDLAIKVEGTKTVHEGHRIAHSIKDAILEADTGVGDVLVHVDPHDDEAGRSASPALD